MDHNERRPGQSCRNGGGNEAQKRLNVYGGDDPFYEDREEEGQTICGEDESIGQQ